MSKKRRLIPDPGRILVQRRKVDERAIRSDGTKSELIVVPDEVKERNQSWTKEALVLAVGEPEVTDFGTIISCSHKPGDTVLVAPTSGMDITLNGETVTVCRFGEIIGRIEEYEDSPLIVPVGLQVV